MVLDLKYVKYKNNSTQEEEFSSAVGKLEVLDRAIS